MTLISRFTAKDAQPPQQAKTGLAGDPGLAKESKANRAGESNIAPELSTAVADAMPKLFFDNQQSEARAQPLVASRKRVYALVSKGGARTPLALDALARRRYRGA
jgi:hypothetical protein